MDGWFTSPPSQNGCSSKNLSSNHPSCYMACTPFKYVIQSAATTFVFHSVWLFFFYGSQDLNVVLVFPCRLPWPCWPASPPAGTEQCGHPQNGILKAFVHGSPDSPFKEWFWTEKSPKRGKITGELHTYNNMCLVHADKRKFFKTIANLSLVPIRSAVEIELVN